MVTHTSRREIQTYSYRKAVRTEHQERINKGNKMTKTKERDRLGEELVQECWKGHTDSVKELLKKGVNINKADADGHTPLHITCLEGHTKVVEILLKNGADVNMPDSGGGFTDIYRVSNGAPALFTISMFALFARSNLTISR
jgi:ankyrin repeat protein